MTTTAGDIYAALDRLAPFHTALSFDNAGFLVGDGDVEVTAALLSLDITSEVVREAETLGAQLIVSHHPVIFEPLRRLDARGAAYRLARSGIAAICAHTNLDMAAGGVNTCLAQRLGLRETRGAALVPETGAAQFLVGDLPQALAPRAFAARVKEALPCGGLRYTDGGRPVKTVAVCGGAGGEFLETAAALSADAFVTADVKHHVLLLARERGLTLVDAGHFATENVVIAPLCARLSAQFPEVRFLVSQRHRDPACYL